MKFECGEGFHSIFAQMFAWWGRFCTRRSLEVFVVAFLVFFGLCFGLFAAEEEDRVEELWVEKGTRLREERTFFEERFGGLHRKQMIITKSATGGTASTVEQIKAHIDILVPLYKRDESGIFEDSPFDQYHGITEESVSNDDSLFIKSPMLPALEFTETSFCERPPLADLYKGGLYSSGPIAKAYQKLTECQYSMGALPVPLPEAWGLDRWPCTRSSISDCFQDGGYAYPYRLRQLAKVSRTVFNFKQTNATEYKLCWGFALQETEKYYNNTVFPLVHPDWSAEVVAAESTKLQALAGFLLDKFVDSFVAFGYDNRAPLSQFTTDTQLQTYLAEAFNTKDDDIKECALVPGKPCCVSWSGSVRLNEVTFTADSEKDPVSKLWTGKIGMLRTTAINYNENHPIFKVRMKGLASKELTDDERLELSREFELHWIESMKPRWKREAGSHNGPGEEYENTLTYFQAHRTADDTIEDGSKPETHLIVIGYVVLLVYATFSLSRISFPMTSTNWVYSHMLLGFCGVIVVAFATVVGFGFTALCGSKMSPINNNLVPFLALGIGVDDMFVLSHTLLRFHGMRTVEDRLEKTLEVAGPSVFLTSLANSCAFFVAALTPIPAVSLFVIQMGITAIVNFVVLLCLFVPLMVWDSKRLESKRVDFICIDANAMVPEESSEEVQSRGSWIARFVKNYYGPMLSRFIVKVAVIVVFVAFFCVMIWSASTRTESGLRMADIALRGSYFRDFLDQLDEFGLFDNYVVVGTRRGIADPLIQTKQPCLDYCGEIENMMDFSTESVQKMMLEIVGTLSASGTVLTNPPISLWLGSMLFLGNTLLNNTDTKLPFPGDDCGAFYGFGVGMECAGQGSEKNLWYNMDTLLPYVKLLSVTQNKSELANFDGGFRYWAQSLGYSDVPDLYCVSLDPTKMGERVDCEKPDKYTVVESSKFTILNDGLLEHEAFLDVIRATRKLLDSVNDKYVESTKNDRASRQVQKGNVFVFGYIYQYWEQFLDIENRMLEIVGFSLLGVFIATFLFQFSPISSLLVSAVILMIDVELYGLINLLDVKLNAFSLVNLVMAVGMAVEFTAHITHVFLLATGDRNERMVQSLVEIMAPMTNGFLSSFLAVVGLAFARFPFFRSYYFGMFTLMIVISYFNGMVLLPVLLSLVGPRSMNRKGQPLQGEPGVAMPPPKTSSTIDVAVDV